MSDGWNPYPYGQRVIWEDEAKRIAASRGMDGDTQWLADALRKAHRKGFADVRWRIEKAAEELSGAAAESKFDRGHLFGLECLIIGLHDKNTEHGVL